MNEVFTEKAEVLRRFLQRSREEKKQVDMGLQTAHQLVSVIEFRPQVGTICMLEGGLAVVLLQLHARQHHAHLLW